MPKTAIVYRSAHHGNTKKLLDAIVKSHPDVTLIQAKDKNIDLSPYDIIGFASGIYASRLEPSVGKVMSSFDGSGKKAFVIYTCGDKAGEKYGKRFLDTLAEHGFTIYGFYWCLGHDSFGPLCIIGGIHKDRPNANDIQGAVNFYEGLVW